MSKASRDKKKTSKESMKNETRIPTNSDKNQTQGQTSKK